MARVQKSSYGPECRKVVMASTYGQSAELVMFPLLEPVGPHSINKPLSSVLLKIKQSSVECVAKKTRHKIVDPRVCARAERAM